MFKEFGHGKESIIKLKKEEPSLNAIINIFKSEEKFIQEIETYVNSSDYKIGSDAFTRQVLGGSSNNISQGEFVKFRKLIARIAKDITEDIIDSTQGEIDRFKKEQIIESAKRAQLKEQRRTGTHPEVKNQR